MKDTYVTPMIEVLTVDLAPMLAGSSNPQKLQGQTKVDYNDADDSDKDETFTGFGSWDGDVL